MKRVLLFCVTFVMAIAMHAQVPSGYVDLGLPSGTIWKENNENGFYDYDAAVRAFGTKLPTKEQWEELKTVCRWTWTGSSYRVTGPNDESIVLPAAGCRLCDGSVNYVGSICYYWSSAPDGSDCAWTLYFNSIKVYMGRYYRCLGTSVRLVQD